MKTIYRFFALFLILGNFAQTAQGQAIDTNDCHDALYSADANGDRRIDGNEYVTVIQILSPGLVDDAQSFEDLPVLLRAGFNLLACLCQLEDGAAHDCCVGDNANISNEGTGPGETPTPQQELYLFTVCLTTERNIERVKGTSAPSESPFPTIAPTLAPVTPTNAPTTPKPTTLAPVTLAPTDGPVTIEPTTAVPTTRPPTPKPTTLAPTTLAPTTLAPTPKPTTLTPTTLAPTPKPTTRVPTTRPPTDVPVTTQPITPIPTTSTPTTAFPATPRPTTVIPTPTPIFPTDAPVTEPPTPPENDLIVSVDYVVALRNGMQGEFTRDLDDSMDVLAPQVAVETFGRLRKLRRRRLAVDVMLPTLVTGSIETTCPTFINPNDSCLDIAHSITLIYGNENEGSVRDEFTGELSAAIAAGRLEEILQQLYPSSTVYIVTGLETAPTSAPTPAPGGGLSSGGTAGIAIAAVVAVVVVGGFVYMSRRRGSKEEEDTYFPGVATTGEQQQLSQSAVEKDIGPGGETLGASKKSKASARALVEGGNTDANVGQAHEGDSSSNAGSSGWSSSAGVSSLNTGSMDEMDEGGHGVGLAAIGAASALAGSTSEKKGRAAGDVPTVPVVTREDLDSAIEAGDWAAVGATAALLAAASDSQSFSSRSRKTETSLSRGGSSMSSLDAARAAELDHLVDAGDWEGVVMAAAKFEASEDTSTGASRETGTRGSSVYSQGSTTESAGKSANRDAIRAEVESLVRRVVPEEIDNVDEMMLQFKGREEELVETLRTMQERQVAQKARVQGQKQAKRDARRTAQEGGITLPLPPGRSGASAGAPASKSGGDVSAAAAAGIGLGVAAAAGIAAAVGAIGTSSSDEDENMQDSSSASGTDSEGESAFATGTMSIPSMLGGEGDTSARSRSDSASDEISSKKRRTALELAIEAGDWEAVGEAAAMMSDASVTSASTGEINRIADQGDASTFSGDSKDNRYRINAERAAELDDMIDRGDWTGVVAAASRFSAGDSSSSPTAQDAPASTEGLGSAYAAASGRATEGSAMEGDREQRLKEEQEALAQAEIWMAIAEQSKQEGSTEAAGASDAADWAIARSLSALRSAEAKGELEGKNSQSDAEDSADADKSV